MAKKPALGVHATWILTGALMLAPPPVGAQVYSCTSSNGKAYRSATPCSPYDSRPALIYYGPDETSPGRNSLRQPHTGRAAEELRYMNARCASMHEAIRTAGVRGLGPDTLGELQRNFQLECRDDLRQAQRTLAREKGELDRQRETERLTVERQNSAAQEADRLRYEQCAEMRKIIASRKARPNMTEGELGDLARLEERYNSRCRQGS